jgi:hypothetical protein
MDVESVVTTYDSAWRETDAERRLALLEQAWADDGVYQDPTARVEGREALVAHIGTVMEQFAGHTIELTSGVDSHGQVLRFSWVMRDPNGNAILEGMDFGQLADDGRLAGITGFFGPFPER